MEVIPDKMGIFYIQLVESLVSGKCGFFLECASRIEHFMGKAIHKRVIPIGCRW